MCRSTKVVACIILPTHKQAKEDLTVHSGCDYLQRKIKVRKKNMTKMKL